MNLENISVIRNWKGRDTDFEGLHGFDCSIDCRWDYVELGGKYYPNLDCLATLERGMNNMGYLFLIILLN